MAGPGERFWMARIVDSESNEARDDSVGSLEGEPLAAMALGVIYRQDKVNIQETLF